MDKMESARSKQRDRKRYTKDMDHTSSGTKYIVLERMAARFSWQGKGTDALRVVLQEEQAKLNRLEDGGNSQQIRFWRGPGSQLLQGGPIIQVSLMAHDADNWETPQ